MNEPARFRYREPAPRLWPWILFALACLLALGAIALWGFSEPEPPPPPPRPTPITVYRMPRMDLERLAESVRSV